MFDNLRDLSLTRRLADALFRRASRRRLRRFDSGIAERVQQHILHGLVNRARSTLFGKDHDFGRVRTLADFRRLVPLRSPADLWQHYGSPALTILDNGTWPGAARFLATCDTAARTPLVVSWELVQSHRNALLAALSLVVDARPQARLLSGSLLLVGGDTALTPLGGAMPGNLEELTLAQLPMLLRPYTVVAPYSGAASLQALASRAASMPVTCLIGNARRLGQLAALLREQTGRPSLRQIWPGLQAVLFSRGPNDPERQHIANQIGDSSILLMEACVRPEGVVAIEDPRRQQLRLLHDHGVFFEFVPLDDLGRSQPRRLGLGEIATGVPYALAVTSPAGMWACLVGLAVTFAQREPCLIQAIEKCQPSVPSREVLPLRMDLLPTPPVRHPQSAGTPAAPARKLARSPWSGRADRR